jgi:hypothetical protein
MFSKMYFTNNTPQPQQVRAIPAMAPVITNGNVLRSLLFPTKPKGCSSCGR